MCDLDFTELNISPFLPVFNHLNKKFNNNTFVILRSAGCWQYGMIHYVFPYIFELSASVVDKR